MLTWGALNVVGSSDTERNAFDRNRKAMSMRVRGKIEQLGFESDGDGWSAKAFLYCVEVRCPQTGWLVPLLPSRIISKKQRVVADLVPDVTNKRYEIRIECNVSNARVQGASVGTVRREKRGGKLFLYHKVNDTPYKTNISTLRGDTQRPDGSSANRLRLWAKEDIAPRPDDLLQERLYCIQWERKRDDTKSRFDYEFRTVTPSDMKREAAVESYVNQHLADWQAKGWVPDMRIEADATSRTEGERLIWARGWTHWHHLFNPRQLLLGALLNQHGDARLKFGVTQALNRNCRLCIWNHGGDKTEGTFYNQALNPLFNYGCRGSAFCTRTCPANV